MENKSKMKLSALSHVIFVVIPYAKTLILNEVSLQ